MCQRRQDRLGEVAQGEGMQTRCIHHGRNLDHDLVRQVVDVPRLGMLT